MRSLGKLFQIFILEGKNELRFEFTLVFGCNSFIG